MRAVLKREQRYSWCCVVVWLDIFSIRAAPLCLNDSCSRHKLLQFRCQPQPLCRHPISVSHGCFHRISAWRWPYYHESARVAPVQSKCLLGTNFCATKQKPVPLTQSLCAFFSACWLVGWLEFTCFFVSSWWRRCCENLWPHKDDKHVEKSLYQESPTFFNLTATSRVLSHTKGKRIATLFWSNTFCLVSL